MFQRSCDISHKIKMPFQREEIMPGSPDFLDIGDQLMKSGELDILLNMIRGTGTKEQHEYIRLFGDKALRAASETGHKEMVKYLLSSPILLRDGEGDDGANSLVIAMGRLDHELVRLLAKPQLQDFEPEFLCDALGELNKMIGAETSERKRRKMAKLRAAIAESELHGLCTNKEHGSPSPTRESDDLLTSTGKYFPYINEDAEGLRSVNEAYDEHMKGRVSDGYVHLGIAQIEHLANICMKSEAATGEAMPSWELSSILPRDNCQHEGFERDNCAMIHSLVCLSKSLEATLPTTSELMAKLRPKFTLVGSVSEGTRLGLANELDLTVKFHGWPEGCFCVEGGPFDLKKTEATPEWMADHLDSAGCFLYNKFKYDFLKAVEKALGEVEMPGTETSDRLRLVTTNEEFQGGKTRCSADCSKRLDKCQRGLLFQQCKYCAVAVSQTKVGPCLQFEYGDDKGVVYCSVDLIPMFDIMEMEAVDLARIAVRGMLEYRPAGWLKNIMGYAKHDKVMMALSEEVGITTVKTVSLKTMNCDAGMNFYVRPGQVIGPEKFTDAAAKGIFLQIKWLSKLAKADLNMFWVKKELRAFGKTGGGYGWSWMLLCKDKFRRELEDIIDYEKWKKDPNLSEIPLKRSTEG